MRRARTILAVGSGLIGLVGAVALGRALTLRSTQIAGAPVAIAVDPAGAVERLAAALRLPTVTPAPGEAARGAPLRALHELLRVSYPCFHRAATRAVIAEYSLLYTWEGSDGRLAPALFVGGVDVAPTTGEGWTHPPFAGVVAGGSVWGRGAASEKGGVIALLEAAEGLCAAGWRPARGIWFAFGHDSGGEATGAAALAEALKARGARPAAIVAEGQTGAEDGFPGLEAPLAVIGVAEKGEATVALRARGSGEASTPPRRSAAGRVAEAAGRAEAAEPPAALRPPIDGMLAALAPELALGWRLRLANLWASERAVVAALAADPRTRALVQTTATVTALRAEAAEGGLPEAAEAALNLRIAPGSSVDAAVAAVRAAVGDAEVTVAAEGPTAEPSEVTAVGSGYAWLAAAVRGVVPEAVVAPGLALGPTEARRYAGLGGEALRFDALALGGAGGATRGREERVEIAAFLRAIAVKAALLRAAAAAP